MCKKNGAPCGALGDPTTRITRGSDPQVLYHPYIGKPTPKLNTNGAFGNISEREGGKFHVLQAKSCGEYAFLERTGLSHTLLPSIQGAEREIIRSGED
jgi:hypothetical protein